MPNSNLSAAQIRAIGDINKQTPVITYKGKQYTQQYDRKNDGMPYFKLPSTELWPGKKTLEELEDTFNTKTAYAYAYGRTSDAPGNYRVMTFADRSGKTEQIFGRNQHTLQLLHNLVRALYDIYQENHPEMDGKHKRGQYMELVNTLKNHGDFYNMPPARFKKVIEVAVDNGYAKIIKKQGKVYISTTNAGLVSEFG